MYLSLGNEFQEEHDRAIRFLDEERAIAKAKELSGVDEYCRICHCFHIKSKQV